MQNLVLTQGAVTEVIGCYNNNFRFDEGAMKAQIDYQCNAGIKGLFGNSISSDCTLLHDNMDEDLARIMVKATAGRVPVMFQVFESNASLAIEKAQRYKDLGVDVVLLSQPYMRGVTTEGVRRYFSTIFDKVDCTMGIHNSPQRLSYLEPEIIAEMANTYDHCVYVKNATQSMAHIQTLHLLIKNPNFRYFEGSDSTILATMVGGGHGVVSAISSLFPKIVIELCEACLAGEWEKAKFLNERVSRIRYINYMAESGSVLRFIASATGAFNGGPELPPHQELTDADKQLLLDEYSKLDWLECTLTARKQ